MTATAPRCSWHRAPVDEATAIRLAHSGHEPQECPVCHRWLFELEMGAPPDAGPLDPRVVRLVGQIERLTGKRVVVTVVPADLTAGQLVRLRGLIAAAAAEEAEPAIPGGLT